jgi:hypothetical protein
MSPAVPSIAHLVNPVSGHRELDAVQTITFASMRDARAHAAGAAQVELLAAGFVDDDPLPGGFRSTRPLARSVLDAGRFALPRRLPLIGDLIERLVESSDAEWLVYTNVDIGLSADFYRQLARLGEEADAFTINRRTVAATPEQARDLEWLRAQPGEPHWGHDCFVFHRRLVEGVDLGTVCIGFPPVGQLLLAVLSTLAPRFRVHDQLHLTFHVNDDRSWCDPRYDDYLAHNCAEALAALDRVAQKRRLSPLAEEARANIAGHRSFAGW